MKTDYLLETSRSKNKEHVVELGAVNLMSPERAAVYLSYLRGSQVISFAFGVLGVFMLGGFLLPVLEQFDVLSGSAITTLLNSIYRTSLSGKIMFSMFFVLIGASIYAGGGKLLYATGRLKGAPYQVSSGKFISCKAKRRRTKQHSRSYSYYLLVTFIDENGVKRTATSPYANKEYMQRLTEGSPLVIVSVNGLFGKPARVVFLKEHFSEVTY